MSQPATESAGVNFDTDRSRPGSFTGTGSRKSMRRSEGRDTDSYDPSPSLKRRGGLVLDKEPVLQEPYIVCDPQTSGASKSGSSSDRCAGVLLDQPRHAEYNGDANGQRTRECANTAIVERDLESEEVEDPADDMEDRAYRARRRLRREGKKPMIPAQRILSGKKRTGRRRLRGTDDASSLHQFDIAPPSSPIPPHSSTHAPNNLRSSPLSISRSHPSPHLPTSTLSLSTRSPTDDTVLTLTNSVSITTSPSSTATNTVGLVRHTPSPIPIIAGTLAGVIALLAAVVVTIVVTRKNRAERAHLRNRINWLEQQQQGGSGSGSASIGLTGGAGRVANRSPGSTRSGDGRRGGRGRDKARKRPRRRARSRSSSNETVSTDDNDDQHEMRSEVASSFRGAFDFGARGSVARCFDIPEHPDTRTAKPGPGKVRKKKPPCNAIMDEDASKFQEDTELAYNDEPHALDSPYIELHVCHDRSNNYSNTDRQPSPRAACLYPPPVNVYGTMSSSSSSPRDPALPPESGRTNIQRPRSKQPRLSRSQSHTSLPVSWKPDHPTGQSASSISSLSPASHTPPPLLGAQGMLTRPRLIDVKDPNGPPDASITMYINGLGDLPPAYDMK